MLHRGTHRTWYEITPEGITTFSVFGGNHEGRREFENHMTLGQFDALAAAVDSVREAGTDPIKRLDALQVRADEALEQIVSTRSTKRLEALEAMSDEKLEQMAAKRGVAVAKDLTGEDRRLALILLIDAASPEDSPEVEEPAEEYDPEHEGSGGEEVTVEPERTTPAPDAREPEPTEDLPAGDAFGESVQGEPAGGPPTGVSPTVPTEQMPIAEPALSAIDERAQAAADIAAAKPEPEFSTHVDESDHPQ